jgi:hypothetical protein
MDRSNCFYFTVRIVSLIISFTLCSVYWRLKKNEYRITSVVKAETDIITSIKVRQKGQHVIWYAVTFVLVYKWITVVFYCIDFILLFALKRRFKKEHIFLCQTLNDIFDCEDIATEISEAERTTCNIVCSDLHNIHSWFYQ